MIYTILGLVVTSVFYVWVFSPLETTDRIGVTTAISMVALAVLTSIYAWHTRKMADEMREQRFGEARPYLLLRLDLADEELLQWDTYKEMEALEEFTVTILNAGKGPAINLEASLWHPDKIFLSEKKGFLAPNEKWNATISRISLDLVESGIEKEGWLPELKRGIKQEYTGVIAVKYSDIHHRVWVSYLCLERHIDVEAFVSESEQNIVELKT